MIGKEILNYRIESLLGQGGMGSVYLATNKNIDQKVAIKVLNANLSNSCVLKERFKKEAKTLAELDHPNIVKFLNYVENEDGVFLIMEYVKGTTLEEFILKKTGPIVEERVFDMFHSILNAFAYAHKQGIIHRDIKPSNIVITHNQNIKILDFGIARIISESNENEKGMILGTPMYMSPEQVKGKEVDVRSDIYSLGVLLHQMLTGQAPYNDTTLSEFDIKSKVLEEKLPRMKEYYPYISDKLQMIVDKAVEKEPNNRYQNCEDFRNDFVKVLRPETSNKIYKKMAIVTAAVLFIIGFVCLDYFRTKTYYYKDYVEKWGVPQGIHKLSSNKVGHRELSYKFEFKKRKLRRMTFVNSRNQIRDHHDSEHMERPTDMKLYYQDNGTLDYVEYLDNNGKILFLKDYSPDMKVLTFKRADEFGTELSLNANTLKIFQNPMSDNASTKGQISRYLLTYDNNGFVEKLEYAKYQNVKTGDLDGIYARIYERDSKGRVIKETYLGANGQIKETKKGLAIREHKFIENDDWVETSYFDRNHNASKDETGVPVVRLYYDQYGNRIKEEYVNSNGELVYRTDTKSAGFKYKYDENGFNIERRYFDVDGKDCIGSNGVAGITMQYNKNGDVIKYFNIDIDGNAAYDVENGYFGYKADYDENGNIIVLWFIDKNGEIAECKNGHAGLTYKYDSIGNNTEIIYYDIDKKPMLTPDGVAGYRYIFNDMNLIKEVQCLNTDLKIALSENDGIAIWKNNYDERGNRIGASFYNETGKELVLHQIDNYAGWACKYDDNGNQIEYWKFDTDSALTTANDNYAGYVSHYDEKGNEIERFFYDTKRNLVENSDGYAGWIAEYDERGNEILDKKIDVNKQPAKGWLVAKSKYDKNDNIIEYLLYDYKENLAIGSNGYAGYKAEYDAKNNMTKISYYGTRGELTNASNGYAYAVYTYNEKGYTTSGKFFDNKSQAVNSKDYEAPMFIKKYDYAGNVIYQGTFLHDGITPVENSNGIHYGTVEYDRFGNMTCLTGYDKNGTFAPYINGCGRKRMKYDLQGNETEVTYCGENDDMVNCNLGYAILHKELNKKGQIISISYFDKQNNPTINTEENAHRIEYDYDSKGNEIELRYFGTDGSLRTNGFAYEKRKYNNAGNLLEQAFFDANQRSCRCDSKYDYCKVVFERRASGELLYKRFYQLNGNLFATLDSEGNRVYSNSEVCDYVNNIDIPKSITDGLDFVSADCDNRMANFIWKLSSWSKYELNDSNRGSLKDKIKRIAEDQENIKALKSIKWRIQVVIFDKADREIFRYIF